MGGTIEAREDAADCCKSNHESEQKTMNKTKLTTCTASVILDGTTEMEPFTFGGPICRETMATLAHACCVESDLDEMFNMRSEDGSVTFVLGVTNLIDAADYLKGFSDKELLADGDPHGIEHCRELVHDLFQAFQAAGVLSAIKLNFKPAN